MNTEKDESTLPPERITCDELLIALIDETNEKHISPEQLLKILTDGKYISPEETKELLEELGIGVTISEKEMKFLRKQMPKELSNALIKELLKLERVSEENSAPILIAIPRCFTIINSELAIYCDETGTEKEFAIGEAIPLTCENMQRMFSYAKANGKQIKELWRDVNYIPGSLWKRETATGTFKAFSSTCLKDSKNKTYENQKKHREKVLGKEYTYKIEAPDSYLAIVFHYLQMVFHYLQTDINESLFLQDFCRLDTLDSYSAPLYLTSYSDALCLSRSSKIADHGGGIGFSREFLR